ncbi:MAG: TonB-dependent receptor plug domain-containing protein, partial [Cellvibrionaceae bacterium]|nr:TonB-dependent receptor plug domain-containing protein [Cellvibrionaceae bacterium]
MKTNFSKNLLALAMATSAAYAQAEDAAPANDTIEEVTVIGKSVSYANNSASSEMIKQQSAMTSPLAVIDNLPGVLVNEGDTFGTDDWSTTVSIRGFQLSLDSQQVGVTVDGIANGNSNYGGGAKANRYIDTENLQTVEVSQGTADVASRSNEALGGTLNFTTIDPGEEERLTLSVTAGDADASKYFVRYETGEILPETYAWLSVSSSENADWIDGSAENTRDHFAGKLISTINDINITAYVSYDDVHEDNYQRVSLAQFEQDPSWDRLTGEWTGTPYVDQLYRKGWSTLRENLFGYLKAEFELGQVEVNTNIYYHKNEGRGDWVPPYMVDVTDDGANGHSELQGNTVMGGAPLGRIFFVDANGNSLSPNAGCQSSITFPYGGAGPEYDPKCYGAGAIAVGSYRHTHYAKERKGFNADFVWETSFGDVDNTLRGGIWYEDYHREEYRDWHKIIDSSVGYNFDHQAYWVQYSVAFPVDTM